MNDMKKVLEEKLGKVVKVSIDNGIEKDDYIGIITLEINFNLEKDINEKNNFVLFTKYGEIIRFNNLLSKALIYDDVSIKITSVKGVSKEERDILRNYHNKVKKSYKLYKESFEIFNSSKEEADSLRRVNKVYSSDEFCVKLSNMISNSKINLYNQSLVLIIGEYKVTIYNRNNIIKSINLTLTKDVEKYTNKSFIGEKEDFYGKYKYIKHNSVEYLESLIIYEKKYKDNKFSELLNNYFYINKDSSFLEIGDKDWLTYKHNMLLIPKKEMLLNDESLNTLSLLFNLK